MALTWDETQEQKGQPVPIRSIRIPNSLWAEIKTFHDKNAPYSWQGFSATIRLLLHAGLEYLEKKPEPEPTKKKRGRPPKQDVQERR